MEKNSYSSPKSAVIYKKLPCVYFEVSICLHLQTHMLGVLFLIACQSRQDKKTKGKARIQERNTACRGKETNDQSHLRQWPIGGKGKDRFRRVSGGTLLGAGDNFLLWVFSSPLPVFPGTVRSSPQELGRKGSMATAGPGQLGERVVIPGGTGSRESGSRVHLWRGSFYSSVYSLYWVLTKCFQTVSQVFTNTSDLLEGSG
jgi:hypothetical protein